MNKTENQTGTGGGRPQTVAFHLPQKPFDIVGMINRIAAGQGSPRYAMATANADYNGHATRLWWNDYRGYYIVEYQWGQRVVITRSTDPRAAIRAAIQEYKLQGLGASLTVGLLEEHAAVASEFSELVAGEEKEMPWRTWKFSEAASAYRFERQTGIPYVTALLQATDKDDYKKRIDDYVKARRAPRPSAGETMLSAAT